MNRYAKNININFFLMVTDVFVIALCHLFSCYIEGLTGGSYISWYSFGFYAILMIALFVIFDFYNYVDDTIYNNCVSIAISAAMTSLAKLFVSFFVGFDYYGYVYTPVMFASMVLLLCLWRALFSTILLKKSKTVLILESIDIPTRVARKIKYYDRHPELIWYCMVDEADSENVDYVINDLMTRYDVIFISNHISNELSRRIIRRAIELDKSVRQISNLHNTSIHFGILKNTTDTPVVEMVKLGLTKRQKFNKRVFDIIASSILIFLTMPIQLIISVIIRLDSPGGAIYSQERYTKDKTKFILYKFRTMHTDAEKNGAQLTTKNDARTTRVGSILRKTHLDEIPQLFNVLIGDMSFVGPRPERPVFADEFCEKVNDYDLRYKVKAGVTGYAQVYGNYSSRASDKILMDIIYMTHYSFYLDIKLILMTLRQIFIHDRAEGLDVELEMSLDVPEKEIERINASYKDLETQYEKELNSNTRL